MKLQIKIMINQNKYCVSVTLIEYKENKQNNYKKYEKNL